MGVKLRLFASISVVFVGFLLFKALHIPDVRIEGWTADGFEHLRIVYRDLFSEKVEKGSAFAAYFRGRLVAHLWAGCRDFFCSSRWEANTTAVIHSSTKFLGALCLAVMADRGHLNYSRPVAHYWPGFAAAGKADVTVDQLLSHRAGLVGVEPPLTLGQVAEDGDLLSDRLAQQKPAWTPGSEAHYHALTIGLYMDQLFRHVHPDGTSCVRFLETEVFAPLGLDIRVGLKDADQEARLAEPLLLSNLWMSAHPFQNNATATKAVLKTFFYFPNSTYRAIMAPFARTVLGHDFFRRDYLALPLLSANGIASADSLARLMGVVAEGGQESADQFPRQLIRRSETIRALTQPLADFSWMSNREEVLMARGNNLVRSPAGSWMLGAPGMGGQMAFADPEKRVGWAYITNHMSLYNCADDPRHLRLVEALYEAVKRLEEGLKPRL